MNTMFDLPWDHPVKAEAKRSRKVATCALFSRAMVDSLPEGWKVRVARAWSPLHDDVLWTMWLDEPVMGWSEWHSSTDLSDLVDWANGYVDECMATCLPDPWLATPLRCEDCSVPLITLNEEPLTIGCPRCCSTMAHPDQGNGIPTPSKCDVTQGGDKDNMTLIAQCDGGYDGRCKRPRCPCHTPYRMFPDTQDMADTYSRAAGGTPQWCRACLQPKDNDDDLCPACWAGGLR